MNDVEVIQVYKCLCDVQRLRILNLLQEGPLCVCHLVEILDADQIKVSKQLRYMKDLKMVRCDRQAQWMIYSLPEQTVPLVQENLKCLQDVAGEHLCFQEDLQTRARIFERIQETGQACPDPVLRAYACSTETDCGC